MGEGEVGQIVGTVALTVAGAWGAFKLLPAFFSNLSATIAGNKASENTIEVLQELVASERAGRVAAEAELRNFISNWAEMKSKFDVLSNKLDEAAREAEINKAEIRELTRQVQELTDQLKQTKI